MLAGENKMAYFPLFLQLEKNPCLIVGGGKIAFQKVKVLLEFEADIMVVSPYIIEEITKLGVICYRREFSEEDLNGKALVVAATDDNLLNHRIAKFCRDRKILVNCVDQIADCDFIFPSYIKEGGIVIGISSSGKGPVMTQYLKGKIQKVVTKQMGQLAEFLGSMRPRVKEEIIIEERRKKIYQDLLQLGLQKKCLPDENETEEIIKKYKK